MELCANANLLLRRNEHFLKDLKSFYLMSKNIEVFMKLNEFNIIIYYELGSLFVD